MSEAARGGADCIDVLVIGVVKGGTSELVRTLRDSYKDVLQGPTGGPWHGNSEVMWCTPHCPGSSAWGVFAHPSGGVEPADTCDVCGLREEQGLPWWFEYEEACRRPGCWPSMLSEHFGSTAATGPRLLAKNPDAFFWPHLASIFVQRAMQCQTRLLVMLRDPVQRTLSHFGWYWRKLAAASPLNSTVAFGNWLELSLSAYSDTLRQFASDEGTPTEHVQQWRDFCYGLESEEQRAHWAPFFGVFEPSGFTHDGLAVIKGLPQSVYAPQLLTWRQQLLPYKKASAGLLRVVQSEQLRLDSSEMKRITEWLGLAHVPTKDAPSSDELYSSVAHGTKPRSAELERRLVDFFQPHNVRLFELVAQMGQPFDERLWQVPAAETPSAAEPPPAAEPPSAAEPASTRSASTHTPAMLPVELEVQLQGSRVDPYAGTQELGALPSEQQSSDAAAVAPDVIFLSRNPEVGSAQARGAQISAHWPRGVLLGWDNLMDDCAKVRAAGGGDSCASLTRDKMVVHIKDVFEDALKELPHAAHVYDPVDKGADQMYSSLWEDAADPRLCGVIAHNSAHAALFRGKARVWEIPHHAMPACDAGAVGGDRPREAELRAKHRRRTVVVVGGEPKPTLRKQLARLKGRPTVLYESEACTVNQGNQSLDCLCSLLSRASVAVAWDQIGRTDTMALCEETTGLSAKQCFALKPNERLINPLSAGTPTVGFYSYPSFRDAVTSENESDPPPEILLAKDLSQLKEYLQTLLTNYSAWQSARRNGLRIGSRFSMDQTVGAYEEVRTAAMAAKARGSC